MKKFIQLTHYDENSGNFASVRVNPDAIILTTPIVYQVPSTIESPDGEQTTVEKTFTSIILNSNIRVNAAESAEQIDQLIANL